ncbi:MAG: methylmalonyl-CoA epimerase, partial [Bacteroidetes bacterium]|nr:methylmalonyl-CoA epimerase [Bacteroidota bacterium]
MKKIEHIGIAVEDLTHAVDIYEKLLGVGSYKQEVVITEAVKTAFFLIGDTKLELLQATSPDSAIAKFLEKRGQGFHHIAFEVEDIEWEISRLRNEGFNLLHQTAKEGADNKQIAFLHPKSGLGMLIEL